MFWLAGIGKKFFSWGLLFCMLTAPLGWAVLKPYQKKRILVFLGEGDSKKERYHIEQSKIAIGSGTTTGKGFCQGTQNKLLFLPESRTDFIFAVIGEEWGLAGTLLVIALYLLLSLRILYKILLVPMFFAQLLAIGLYLPIIFSAGINIAMVCGMLPVVGIPLPLMSYGVTSVWITMAGLGWIQGITMRLF
jgi:rod shape determining protein RodA